jgi:hypothetical protein
MENNIINATTNPDLANAAAAQALAEPVAPKQSAKLLPPSDNLVNLPGGLLLPTGEVIKTAEVRELTGKDEEAIGKLTGTGRILNAILNRAVVKIGDKPVTESILDSLLSGDRDTLMLGIYKATFGNTAQFNSYCSGCEETKIVEVNIDEDIKIKTLIDPIGDRTFTVKGKKNEFLVTLPTGLTQKELSTSTNKTNAELSTLLLEQTVLEIDGLSVFGKSQVLNLGIVDRQTIGEELIKRNPGPQINDISVTCPDCDGKVVVPISIGALFRF